ncbi:MAG: hypothetical protein K2R93_21715 [Gemmatimonadaceae bacterium]|nr:hypothetical protein [Gemmatimonadaceae bacterium]
MSAPTPTPTPTPQLTAVLSAERVGGGLPLATDTSARARAIRESQRVAMDASARVRTLRVTPARITLAVGEAVPFNRIQVTALDSAGRPVAGFVPSFSLQDNAMATLRGGVITALEPGITSLRIAPVNFAAPPAGPTARSAVAASVILDISAPSLRTTITRPPVGIDSMVPTELVRHLLGGARLAVGQPISVLDSNVLRGGYVHGSRYGQGTETSIVSFPWTRLATLDTLRRRFDVAGWATPPAPPVVSRPGFQSSGFTGSATPNPMYCRNRDLLMVSVTEARGTETVVSLTHQPGPRPICDPDAMRAPTDRSGSAAMNLIPALAPMPGANTTGGGSGGGIDEAYADARIMTDLPVTDIAEHYRRQLLAAGWTDAERTKTASVAVTTFTLRDSTARRWSGVLTVIGNPPSNRVSVRLALQLVPDAQRRH